MVKNSTGGNKAKGQARKHITAKPSNILRLANDECEMYAQVIKTLGNGMCHVYCYDKVTRLLHIRGKFRGRGKKDNLIKVGTWLLVGLREWESKERSDGKLSNCDLCEVYNDLEKDRLKNIPSIDWSLFIANDNLYSNSKEDNINFTNNDKLTEYENLLKSSTSTKIISIDDIPDEEDINPDDI